MVDLVAQVEELNTLLLDLKEVIFTEADEVAAKLKELEDKISAIGGVDLSEELADLRDSIEKIKSISSDGEDEDVLDV